MISKNPIEFIFETTNLQEVKHFLKQRPNLNIAEFKDEKRNNILHQNAFRNKFALMKLYIQHMRNFYDTENIKHSQQNRKSSRQLIIQWVNDNNEQGFTPVLYASFKGNIDMIRYLQTLGADLLIKTKLGLNMIHLAAQGDRLNVFCYLYTRFDLNGADHKKGTPLHWACYMGSEKVVQFLLSFDNIQKDCYDSQEQTPLHLATIYGNTKIVKRLLVKGANRSLRNGKGQTALQIAKSYQFKNILKMLNQKFTCLDQIRFYCNLKIEYKPTSRSLEKPIILLISLFLVVFTSHLFVRLKHSQYYFFIPGVYYVVLLINYLSLLKIPILHQEPKQFQELLKYPTICCQCKIQKKKRMFHCDICKVCIANYDHHCPWINNCVGIKNIARFITFLIMLLLSMIQVAIFSIAKLSNSTFLFEREYRWQKYAHGIKYFFDVIFAINLAVVIIFLIPLAFLIYIQISNILVNQTTYEKFSKSNLKHEEKPSSQSSSNPLKTKLLSQEYQTKDPPCSCENCHIMCCQQKQEILLQKLVEQ